MNAIVHFATLQELSKRTRPTAVRRWLTKSRIHFKLNADGQPFTTLAIIEEAVQIRRGSKGDPTPQEPNFERLTASAKRLRASRQVPSS
jgi:hypothetical protein